MNFKACVAELSKRSGLPGVGLSGLKRLLRRLGNPQRSLRIVHVAGTNGKGSVCYLTSQVLQEAGYKTGLFISPHLQSLNERISMNGRAISAADFQTLLQQILQAEEEKLNFFELLTAAALLYFAQKKADYVVLETGLGGRRDPTSVCRPTVCAITSVGLDHCALLGSTLAQIAREKAGIIGRNVPVFCAQTSLAAMREIKKQAALKQAPLYEVHSGRPFRLHHIDWQRGRLYLRRGKTLWPLALLGKQQVKNACLVYQLCQFLGVPTQAIARGFEQVCIPGRWEIIKRGKTTWILDGAHNPQAIRQLLQNFRQSPWNGKAALVCGFMRDKDYPAMLRMLRKNFSDIYAAAVAHPRAVSAGELAAQFPPLKTVQNGTVKAVCQAAAAQHAAVVVSGSFYLVGAVRYALERGELD